MARKLSGREAGLLVARGTAAALYFWFSSRQGGAGGPAEAAAGGKSTPGSASKPPEVLLALLAKNVAGYDAEGRDLFKYAVRPPSRAEIEAARLEQERQRKLAEAEARAPSEAGLRDAERNKQVQEELVRHPPPPQPPAISLQYVGYIGPKNDKVAVFLDGEETVVAKKGETLKGQFKVVEIKLESVVMGYTRPEFKDMTRELTLAPASK